MINKQYDMPALNQMAQDFAIENDRMDMMTDMTNGVSGIPTNAFPSGPCCFRGNAMIVCSQIIDDMLDNDEDGEGVSSRSMTHKMILTLDDSTTLEWKDEDAAADEILDSVKDALGIKVALRNSFQPLFRPN